MKISALRLFNVKRFAGRGVAIEGIGEGVNVLCAPNEFGKSTSFEALHALFFQPYSGTPGAVQALRPYSGGNPLVEADIETTAGRFRITKQFYGARSVQVVDLASNRIVRQADEAESFIADVVRGGTAGPAGLLWVRQGVTGIEKRSKSEEDSEKQVRTSLLESVQGEVEAVTGGRRMSEVLATTEAALAQLVTPTGRPKAGERYAVTIEERDRLEAEERRLGGEVKALREALDKRAIAQKRLSDLDRPEDHDARRKAIDAAEAAFNAARSRSSALRAAAAEIKLLQEQRDNAQRDHAKLTAAQAQRLDLAASLATAENRRTAALSRREALAAELAKLRAEDGAAEREEQDSRALLARLDAAIAARKAAEDLAGRARMLEEAEALRIAIEEAEAALALLTLPEQAIADLELLDIEMARLRAVAEATRPSATIAYEPQAAVVMLDGEVLEEGQPRSYGGQARLTIPHVGVVTLRSNRAVGNDDSLAQVERKRRALLTDMGVDDLPAARRRHEAARRQSNDQRERRSRLSWLAPNGLPKLREEVAAQRAIVGQTLEFKDDPCQVRAAHAAAEAKRLTARQAVRDAEPMQALANDEIVSAQTDFARLDAVRAQLEAVLGPIETRASRSAQAEARLADLDGQLAKQQADIEPLRAQGIDLTSAEAVLRRQRSVAEGVAREIGLLREEISGLSAEIRARAEDAVEEKWRETRESLTTARVSVSRYEREVATLQRLRLALETAKGEARDAYLLPVMSELRPLLGLLFDDVSIIFDEKTLLPQKILRNGQEEEVERLSGGMREQLSVLTRLAFARLLAKNGRPAPVILDDALVYSDDDRIEKMFDALHRQACEQQIIVFSCRQRAFQKLGGNALHMSEWSPTARP
jgi:hypothetical protein